MAYKNNFVTDINEKLVEKRYPDDVQTTLNIPEHKFKKVSEKFNYALKSVYDDNIPYGIKMFHIILSLQNYFDMNWLVDTILDDENTTIVKKEMKEEYNISNKRRKKKKKQPINEIIKDTV